MLCSLLTVAACALQSVWPQSPAHSQGCSSVTSVLNAGRHAALARGHIHSVAADAVAVALGKALRSSLLTDARRGPSGCWRIDRDEVASISVRLRRSVMGAPNFAECVLLCADAVLHAVVPMTPLLSPIRTRVWGRTGLFVRGDPQARKLRRLVVDLQSPTVGCTLRSGADAPELNAEQLLAVNRCAAARPVLGPCARYKALAQSRCEQQHSAEAMTSTSEAPIDAYTNAGRACATRNAPPPQGAGNE